MAMKLTFLATLLCLLLASTPKAHASVFDVTSATYGAKPGSDVSMALAKAWSDACASPSASKVVVPSGTYNLKEATFKGPSYNHSTRRRQQKHRWNPYRGFD
ncbi:unnamed protein product [Prunus brigantina]